MLMKGNNLIRTLKTSTKFGKVSMSRVKGTSTLSSYELLKLA